MFSFSFDRRAVICAGPAPAPVLGLAGASLAAVIVAMAFAPALAQTNADLEADFARVEAALSVLEEAQGANDGVDDVVGTDPQGVDQSPARKGPAMAAGTSTDVGSAPVPSFPAPPPVPRDDTQGTGMASFAFPPVLDGQDCPANLADARKAVDALAQQSADVERTIVKLGQRFEALEQQNLNFTIDEEFTGCPKSFTGDLAALVEDLSAADLETRIQEAEALSICVQTGWVTMNERISEVAQSTDPGANAIRADLATVLTRWASADADASRAVSNLVFFEGRRHRLDTALDGILRRCAFLEGNYQ